VGTVFVDEYTDGPGSTTFDVTSRLSSVSDAFPMIAPTIFETDSTSGASEWSMSVDPNGTRINANTFRFTINYNLDEADLDTVTYVVVFVP
jgi:hypothetical protein